MKTQREIKKLRGSTQELRAMDRRMNKRYGDWRTNLSYSYLKLWGKTIIKMADKAEKEGW